jgi:hypothetical protein
MILCHFPLVLGKLIQPKVEGYTYWATATSVTVRFKKAIFEFELNF